MFNFFDELKKAIKDKSLAHSYNLVLMSGKILYVEGHLGIMQLSSEIISFKVKGGVIVVEGKNLTLFELMDKTLKITGEIKNIEAL